MTTIINQGMTLEEHLNYDDGTDTRYELVDGVLVAVGAENPINPQIVSKLSVSCLPSFWVWEFPLIGW
jgi:hypothetical protein